MFFRQNSQKQYLFSDNDIISDIETYDGDIAFTINIDTEYQEIPIELRKLKTDKITLSGIDFNIPLEIQNSRIHISTQISDYNNENQFILSSSDFDKIIDKPWTPLSKHKVHAIDYLEYLGHEVKLLRTETIISSKNIPAFKIIAYSHFAIAELLMTFEGEYRKDILDIIKGYSKSKIEQRNRVRTYTPIGKYHTDNIELPWILNFNGKIYRVQLFIVDTIAVCGVLSYKQFCESNGIKIPDKTLMDDYKSEMLAAYIKFPVEFKKYAMGDLKMIEGLKNYNESLSKVYNDCGIEKTKLAELTIGSTVQKLFHENILNLVREYYPKGFTVAAKKEIYGCQASELKSQTSFTRSILSKCDGGRCRNNQPTLVEMKGSLVDIDIESCYGSGMRFQDYAIGIPIIEDYPITGNNKYISLGEWLKIRKYGSKKSELVDGLWVARVSTSRDLTIPQDLIASWQDWKFKPKNLKEKELDTKTGMSKIFSNQIVNGVVTSDIVDWIFNCCSARQKKELLEKLQIVSVAYYPKYLEYTTLEEFFEAKNNHNGENKTSSGNSKIVKEECNFYGWFRINLGEFLIDLLLTNRKKFPKKHPLNNLYKLITNTIYGVMVSPYFDISNIVSGNNITARARVCCWCLEKALNGVQSITDGVAFDLNSVVYPTRKNCKLTQENTFGLYKFSDKSRKNIKLKPLSGDEKIEVIWGVNKLKIGEKTIEDVSSYIKEKTGEYTQEIEVIWGQNKVIIGEKIIDSLTDYVDSLEKSDYKSEIIMGIDKVRIGEKIIENGNEYVADMAMQHVRNSFDLTMFKQPFSKILVVNGEMVKKPIIGVYGLEIKYFYSQAYFHGTANYCLKSPHNTVVKMRSYESKKHHIIGVENDSIYLKLYPYNSPATYFFKEISKDKTSIGRGLTFTKNSILKIGEYQNNQKRYDDMGKIPGDSIDKIGVLREFSLSQFTYVNVAQYKAIFKESERNKRKYNQTYEGYFIDEKGRLNFQLMVKTLDEIISSGKISINNILDRSRNRARVNMNHVHAQFLDKIKAKYFDEFATEIGDDFTFEFSPYDDNEEMYFPEDIEVVDEFDIDEFELDL